MRQQLDSVLENNVPEKDMPVSECKHFWKIESSNSASSVGVCKYCGAEKEFLNALPDFTVVRRNSVVLPASDSSQPKADSEKDDAQFEDSDAVIPV